MEQLELRQESGGSREMRHWGVSPWTLSRLYLMDKPIHAGDCLEVLISEKWFSARCECYKEQGNLNWYLIVFKPEGEDVIEDCINNVWCRFDS